jgi:uncharacterized membrane protein YccF (DUF307 family)
MSPAARTGLPSDTVASRRVAQRASRCLIGQIIWIFFALVLAAAVAGLVSPVAVWVAAIPIPIALLLRRLPADRPRHFRRAFQVNRIVELASGPN